MNNEGEAFASVSNVFEKRENVCKLLKKTKFCRKYDNDFFFSPLAREVNDDLQIEPCQPIFKIDWKADRDEEQYMIFAGGLPSSDNHSAEQQEQQESPQAESCTIPKLDRATTTQSLTVIHGKTTSVLEMEHNIVDFLTLCDVSWESDFSEPCAILVLLRNDLVIVDLTNPG